MSNFIGHNLKGAKGGKGGGGGRAAQEAPNTLQSKAVARLIDILGEGEIKGLVNGPQSIFFDDTPLQNADGSYNFSGVSWDMRLGTPAQNYMPGFSQVESSLSVNTEVFFDRPVTREINNTDLDAVKVIVRLPALFSQNTTNGDTGPANVAIAIEMSSGGGPFVKVLEDNFNDKCMSAYQQQYRIKLPKGGAPWRIRLKRLTADSKLATLSNKTFFDAVTEVIEAKLQYPDTAYIGLRVDAEEFGSTVPQRVYEVYGRYIQVPANYDQVKRTYNGLWDGVFKLAVSDNPAWVLYDILTNGRFGLGREIPHGVIDKFGLYEIARYCDEPVPDGRGGHEPRFTFNGVINNRTEAINFIALLAGSFRCMPFYALGGLFFNQDKPMPFKRILNQANVVNGEFNYSGTSLKSRHSAALVAWLDPEDGYKQAIEVVEDAESVRMFGWRTLEVEALGCTSRGQAWRLGAHALEVEKNQGEMVTFSTGLDCADIMPGDVVAIADPSFAGARGGGRLLEVGLTGAWMDAAFDFSPGEQYAINLVMPDNTMHRAELINPETVTDQVTFTVPLTIAPLVGSVFTLESSRLYPRLFRIINVEEGEGLIFNFTGYLYDENRYDRVEKGINLPDKPTSLLPTGPLPRPKQLAYAESLYLKNGLTPTAGLTLSWFYEDPRAAGFEVQWRSPGNQVYDGRLYVTGHTVDIDLASQGLYKFRVRAVDALGLHSLWAEIEINAIALFRPPDNVPNFRQTVFGESLVLTWDTLNNAHNIHLSHYELRFYPTLDGSADWAEAGIIRERLEKNATEVTLPLQQGTYLIKAVTIKNIYSPEPALVINGQGLDFARLNVVIESQQNPEWGGLKDLTQITSRRELVLTNDGYSFDDEGFYYFKPTFFDLGEIYTSRLLPFLKVTGQPLSDDIFAYPDVFAYQNVFNPKGGDFWRAFMEYSVSESPPDSPSLVDVFSHADVFAIPDIFCPPDIWSGWRPLTAPLDVKARLYRFRLNLKTLNGQESPLISEAKVIIDMPDRLESGEDLEIGHDGATRINFNIPFYTPPVVTVTLQDARQGDYSTVTAKNREGFTLNIFDRNGDPAARLVDWLAKGYGVKH